MEFWKKLKIDNNIIHISIIIYTKINNNIHILVGKEFNNKPNKTDIGLYSEFSDNFISNDESIVDAISRILFEKTMNMIIDYDEFKKLIFDRKIKYKISNKRIIFIYEISYDQHKYLTDYYNRVFEYLNLCRTTNSLNNLVIETCPFNFFDKSELKWVNYEFINNNIKLFKQLFIKNLMA